MPQERKREGLPDLISNENDSEETGVKCKKIAKVSVTEPKTSADFPGPNDEQYTTIAHCTSLPDVLTVSNFEDAQGEIDHDQPNNIDAGDSGPELKLICGDLFRSIAQNANTLASIVLEPQNHMLLDNFLDDFHGGGMVPWVVGASLKYWASKLPLDEASESATRKLPYLKTTQTLTPRGVVDDPKALDRLEERVNEYLEKLIDEDLYNQGVELLRSIVNKMSVRDAVDPIEAATTSVRMTEQNGLNSQAQAADSEIPDMFMKIRLWS